MNEKIQLYIDCQTKDLIKRIRWTISEQMFSPIRGLKFVQSVKNVKTKPTNESFAISIRA
ncbi:hypothetical protein Bhyg_10902 [Pseudolycoriella hygida]|uniref:Uncharacterized protein n=1 Tax=Pseudolycoriella hygida TaxID=35572 RepID=A0A9Q0MW04_9DIPT|nr:hypothetical protein Bhyg_10902 [Pseudolycoriella hygida]